MAYTLLNPYITLKELAEELKSPVPVPDSDKEDELKRAIFNGSRWVDNYTQRDYFFHDFSIVPLTFNQFSKGLFNDQIFLPYSPILSIPSLTLGTTTLVEDTDFYADRAAGRIYPAAGAWLVSAPDNILTLYATFGYPQTSGSPAAYDPTAVPQGIPAMIALATRLVAAALSGQNRKEVVGLDGQKQSIATNEIPKTVFQILGRQGPILI